MPSADVMRVLVADDEPLSRLRLERLLASWDYSVTAVSDGEEAWQVLSGERAPTLAILDWEMPGLDGVTVCRRVRKLQGVPYVYLILHSSRSELDDLVQAMDAGADDYLRKPCQPYELEVRLRAGKRIIQLQDELIAARESLREQAIRDSLTGAASRRAILDTLDQELSRNGRSTGGNGFGALIVDLDHFKKVNDTLGHLAGDEVLCEVVERILSQIRPYDALGRIGGEEFLVLLGDCDKDQMTAAAERIRQLVAETPFRTSSGALPVTLSLGAAWVASGRQVTARQILNVADRALYNAKAAGRNRLCFDEQWPSDRGLLLFNDPARDERRSSSATSSTRPAR